MIKCVAYFLLICPVIAHRCAAQQVQTYAENGDWVQETSGSLVPVKSLRLKSDTGQIRVLGETTGSVQYSIRNRVHGVSEQEARRIFQGYKTQISEQGSTGWISGDWLGSGKSNSSIDIVVKIPRQVQDLTIDIGNGILDIRDFSGHVQARSGAGDIRVDKIAGAVTASTGGGNIEIGSVDADVTANTGGGRITMASISGKVEADSGGGDVTLLLGQQSATLATGAGSIQVKTCKGSLRLSTGGGKVEVDNAGSRVDIESGGGKIRVGRADGLVRVRDGSGDIELNAVPAVQAETGSGSITANFRIVAGTNRDSEIKVSSGNVRIVLPEMMRMTVAASVDAASPQSITSDFPQIQITSEGDKRYPVTLWAEGKLNGGGPVLRVRASSGKIELKRSR